MNHRERVLVALNHEKPDRIPMDFGGFSDTGIIVGAYERLKDKLGIAGDTMLMDRLDQLAVIDENILKHFDIDTRRLPRKTPSKWSDEFLHDGSIRDMWGVVWKEVTAGHYYPSADVPIGGDGHLSDIYRYRWPDPDDLDEVLPVFQEEARRLHEETDYAVVFSFPGRLMSLGSYLRGFETWLIDMIHNEPFAKALLDKGLEIQLAIGGKWLSVAGRYIDVIHVSDDLGTQRSPMISPRLFRDMIKPRQIRLFKFIREMTNAKILLHSDGCVYPFIDDFIEAGVDILNPLQSGVKNMEPGRLAEEFGGHLCFWGGIDTQNTLPFGTCQDVANEVQKRISQIGRYGGYVLAASHNIQNDVSPDNILTLFETGRQFPL